jgi:uracil-DNA glycosylase
MCLYTPNPNHCRVILSMQTFESLHTAIQACQVCATHLKHGIKPILQIHPQAKILIAGQAPGRQAHDSGLPFDDASGDRLRRWMGISKEAFYDESKVAILPMGFCYPGTGKSGDLPPRPECAATWRAKVLSTLPNIELSLIIGKYAQAYHLPEHRGNLTQAVKGWLDKPSALIPLPHPSPRNNMWLKRNTWFEDRMVLQLQTHINKLLDQHVAMEVKR